MFGGRSFIRRVLRCRECGFAFVDPCVEAPSLYASADIEEYLSLTEQRRRFFKEVRELTVRRGVVLGDGARILDVAAGAGDWLLQWPAVFERCATEIHPLLVGRLVSEGFDVRGAPEDFDGSFDLISAFDFLEHVPDPRVWLRSAWGRLRPGGFLVLGVPDLGKWAARLLGTRYYLYCPMHYSYFTRIAVEQLFAKTLGCAVSVERSPKMYATLGAAVKWLFGAKAARPISGVRLGVGYRASLVVLARRSARGTAA
jgi:SAM-dependent methyltransferase